MTYFIDHRKKSIHLQKFAGDRCGFVGTPAALREFTNCVNYINQLLQAKRYKKCCYCETFHTSLEDEMNRR